MTSLFWCILVVSFQLSLLVKSVAIAGDSVGGPSREFLHASLGAYAGLRSIRCHIDYFRRSYKGDTVTAGFDVAATTVSGDVGFGRHFSIQQGSSVVFSYDGTSIRTIDRAKRRVIIDTSQRFDFFKGRFVSAAVDAVPLSSRSLERALSQSIALEYRGDTISDGTRCAIIHVSYPDAEFATERSETLLVGRNDHLLRQETIYMRVNGAADTTQMRWSRIAVDVPIDEAAINPKTPGGFVEEIYASPKMPQPLSVGTVAPAWKLASTNGDSLSSADLRGKVVLLDFWGTWCAPCLMEIPKLQGLHIKYASRGVIVVGVSCREPSGADPAKVLRDHGGTYATMVHGDSVAQRYTTFGFPTLYIIDRSGRIADVIAGYDDAMEKDIAKTVERLIGE